MIESEEQEILLNTLAEQPQEEIHTIEEDIYVIGVESLNGQAGDLTLKNINGENLVGEGNIALQTPLDETQMAAVNSGIDSTKVAQIATNANNITTLQNTKQDNLTQTQLNAVNSGIDATKVTQIATNTGNITSVTNRVTTIEGKIPSAASSSNKLTDKNYVDNAIATNTANYISDNGQPFQSLADLEAYSGPLTNNDYAFVETVDSAGNDIYTRYKYNASTEQWAEEYTITNPYFTSDQWAAINSGIAANDVTQIGTNKTDIATLQTSKQDKLTTAQQAAVDSGIDATKVQQIATNTTNIATKQDKLIAGTNIQIAADGKTISATDTTYTAGTGLTLTGTQFSVTNPAPDGFFTGPATATGTGTTITLNNTADAPIDEVEKLAGDTFQQTYSGKNLFNINNLAVGNITVTNGVATGTTNEFYTNFGSNTSGIINISILPQVFTITATAYTDGNASTASNAGLNIRIVYTDETFTNVYWRNNDTTARTQSLTNDSGKTISKIILTYANSGSNIWHLSNFQIEAGSTATSYEQYVGGIPSPNPSYPQPVNTVTGEQTVTVTGKNLFDGILEPGYINGTTGLNGINNNYIRGKDYIPVKELTNYKFSTDNANSTSVLVYEYKADKSYNLTSNKVIDLSSYLTTNADTAYIRFRPGYQTTDTSIKFQVEEGTVATAYQPYQSQTYPINLGKNLLDSSTNGWGYITSGGAVDGTTSKQNVLSDYIAVSPDTTYTLSVGNITSGQTTRLNFAFFTADKTFISRDNQSSGSSTSRSTTTPTNCEYMRVFIYKSPDWTDEEAGSAEFQLEFGSTATTYAPYFTPIELCKIGNYQDYIWKDGSDWKIHKTLGKQTISTDDITGVRTNYSNVNYANVRKADDFVGKSNFTYYEVVCESAISKNVNTVGGFDKAAMIGALTSQATAADYYLGFNVGLTTTIAKEKLVGKNIYYQLATPTDTTITDATLIAQLEALANARSYSPQTNITANTPSPNLPTILTIDAFQNNYAGLLARLEKAGM